MYYHVNLLSIFPETVLKMKFHNIDSETLPKSSSFLVKVIHRMSTLLARNATKEFAAITDFNIVEWRVVSGLYAFGKSNQKSLVEFTGGDQAQTSRTLAELERRGLIRTEANGKDRRARDIELTETGWSAVDAAMPNISAYFRRIEETLTQDEKATLIALLNRLLADANDGSNRK